MGTFEWVFGDPGFDKFKDAFDDKRVRQANIYWGPFGANWYSLAAPDWHVAATEAPPVPVPFGVDYAVPQMLYPEVKKTAALLKPAYGNTLYWDPRTGKWIKVTKAGESTSLASLPACVPAMKRQLETIDALYRDRTLEEFEWRSQRERVIEDCLRTLV
jgi:hypothetical protein